MKECKYVVSVEDHSQLICKIIDDMIAQAIARFGFNGLKTQFKTYAGNFPGSKFANVASLGLDAAPKLDQFKGDGSDLEQLELSEIKKFNSCSLQRFSIPVESNNVP